METKLFMKRALASSFRRYTLVAENMIAASTAEAQLVHGVHSNMIIISWYISDINSMWHCARIVQYDAVVICTKIDKELPV